MKQRRPATKKQSGVALILFLVALILAGGYAFYRTSNIASPRIQQDAKLAATLARAKEALIAYAVIDDKRPGRMPCPDIVGDGVSPILTRDDCNGWVSGGPDVYSGWLPWKTLDLAEHADEYGTGFRYAVSRFFGGDRATPLNSDTATSLRFGVPAGTASNDIVAVVIATKGDLDTRNADGDEYYFPGTSQSSDDNDVIAVITRQELMAAVEKRIANELRTCLEQHATNTADNPTQTYPWPAPLSNDIYKGVAKSLFGMVPSTQPGSSPDELLQKSVSDLKNSEIALNSPSTKTAADQLAAIQQIQKAASYARTLFDRLYIVAADVVSKANATSTSFNMASTTISPILANRRTFRTGSSAIPAAIADALPSLAALRTSLVNSGFDTFLHELETQNSSLNTSIATAAANPSATNFGALQTQANLLKRETLGTVYTPNPELASLITTAANTATAAVNAAAAAKASPGDTALANLAIASANNLFTADQVLAQTIKTSRLTIDPAEAAYTIDVAQNALTAFSANATKETTDALLASLESASTSITSIATGSVAVLTARTSALNTLQIAIAATKSGNDAPLIQSASTAAIADLRTLVTAMENNGDNILLETLENIATQLEPSAQTKPATLTAGRGLLTTVNTVKSWADIVSAYAEDIARKSRKGTSALGDSDTSAYTESRQLLSSIDGSTGSIAKLEAYINAPTDTTKQSEAIAALAETQAQLADTISAANQLDTLLESGLAQAAMPTNWYGEACTPLNPPTGSDTWWTSNEWRKFFFYQISARSRPATGELTVNGSNDKYRVVVLSAGRALGAQSRSTRTTLNFFECIDPPTNTQCNHNVLRDNDATTLVTTFWNTTVSDTFNDRLAY
jgi:hypothetical protein